MAIAHNNGIKLYLPTMALSLSLLTSVIDSITDPDLPSHLDKERGANLLFKLLLPFLEDYLYEEQGYVNRICEDGIIQWVSSTKPWCTINSLISKSFIIYRTVGLARNKKKMPNGLPINQGKQSKGKLWVVYQPAFSYYFQKELSLCFQKGYCSSRRSGVIRRNNYSLTLPALFPNRETTKRKAR